MITISEFLRKSGCEEKLAQLTGEVISEAVKKIRAAIGRQGGEYAGSKNVYGESQLALDVQSNNIVVEELKRSGLVKNAASEEMESVMDFGAQQATFSVVFDPLDGSSLVDVNFAVGSIFGVYPAGDLIGRSGDEQLAACFAVYGPHTTLVLTVKKGTHEFRLAPDGNFYLTKENLTIAPKAKHFAPGNLRAAVQRKDYFEYVEKCVTDGLTLRYSGGMVPDINHILLKGNGIFLYPGYLKAPDGKLRLLFECNPMSLLVEQAGGAATDGKQRILAKKVKELHQRTPIYLGSREDVLRIVEK